MRTKTIGFVLLFALAQPVGAQEVGPTRADESAASTRPANPRPRSEAEFYAADFGVPIAEAERRVRLMDARGDEAVDLRVEFKRRFAGIYLDHLPDLRIVVRLTGNTPVASRLAVSKEGSIPIVFVTGAKATLDELETVLDAHEKALYAKIPALQGLYTDDRTGEIVLVVHASAAEAKIYETEVPALVKLLGHPVRFEFESAPTKEAALARGGAVAIGCTTGFSVKETATGGKGILTAAHCLNTQAYANSSDPEYVTFPLEFVAEKYDASHDVQWHIPALGNTPVAEIYGISTRDFDARAIFFRRTRASTMAGDSVCHRGESSGYSCGKVDDTESRAGSCGRLVLCSKTWVRVKGPNLACTSVDSGGPFFHANTAYMRIPLMALQNPHPAVARIQVNAIL